MLYFIRANKSRVDLYFCLNEEALYVAPPPALPTSKKPRVTYLKTKCRQIICFMSPVVFT